MKIFTGRSNQVLAKAICESIGVPMGKCEVRDFPNGETFAKIEENVRGEDVYVVQSTSPPVNQNLMELFIMIDALRRASANRITSVIPFYGYARQDRKDQPRVPISAKLVANLLVAAGCNRVLTMDLHAQQIQGFFDGPVDHLTAMPVLVDRLRSLEGDLTIVSPDAGRVKVAERYAIQLGADLAIVHKRRHHSAFHSVEAKEVVGEVDGKVCILVDDMIDTAGTICAAADQLTERGAARVVAATTHGVFSGQAMERLVASSIEKIIVTDTVPLPEDADHDLIEVLSVAPLIARAIDAVFEDTSVSEIFGGNNLA